MSTGTGTCCSLDRATLPLQSTTPRRWSLQGGFFLCARPAHGHVGVVTPADLGQLDDLLNGFIADRAHEDAAATMSQA